jgi:sulfur carrier protein
MELLVNGKMTPCMDGATLSELLATIEIGPETAGVAVAVNDAVVARSRWGETRLARGDRVEVIHAVQGG